MRHLLPLFIFILALCGEAIGQFEKFKKYKYTWEESFPASVAIEPSFQDQPLVILNEENTLKVSGVKSEFMKVYIEKRQHIKYLSSKELVTGSHFVIPESFDPKLDRSDLPRGNKKFAQRPKLFDVKVLFFAARIKKPDGTIVDARINSEVEMDDRTFQLKSHRTYANTFGSRRVRIENSKSYAYVFQIQNLEPGDELQLHYKYEIPYEQNWYLFNSKRVFYHGNYAKQSYSFTYKFKKKTGSTFRYNNGASPAEKSEEGQNVIYTFKAQNLDGCMGEINARPHLEVPYFVYNLNPLDARYDYQSPYELESAPLPFWIYLLKLREQYSKYELLRTDPLIQDKQWKIVRGFITGATAHIQPDKVFSKLSTLHNIILEDFDYQKDGDYFAGKDVKLERLGDYVENKTLREISRFKLYVKFFNYLNIAYNTVYFTDKRIAKMGGTYISPIIDNEYAFSLPLKDREYYLYPKQHKFGFYGNELPFYWENTPALRIEFFNLWAEKIADLNFINTRSSKASDNIRVCNIKTTVNLNTMTLACEAKVSLAGQFSTMTRGTYTHDYTDSTLNPLYSRRISYGIQGEDHTLLKPKSKSSEYPFKTNFRLDYGSSTLIQHNDSKYQIKLKDWFPHIVEPELQSKDRKMKYYPDFQAQDIIKYFFVFNDSVTLLNKAELTVSIANSYGTYTVSANQLNPTTIMLASEFKLSAEYVPANSIGDVLAINAAIGKLNRGNLAVAKLSGTSH